MRSLADAVAFLTRLPVGARTIAEVDLARAVPWFPAVGALVGAAVGGGHAMGTEVLPPLVSASLAVVAGVLITGAFHEDGLADVADAVGGWTQEDRRRILHDPRHGTYGVLALVTSLVVRVAALASLAGADAVAGAVAAHSLGRGGAVALMGAVPAQPGEGLGARWTEHLSRRHIAAGASSAALVGIITLRWWGLAAIIVVGAGAIFAGAWSRRALGGITGDVLGTAEQLGEIAVLVLAAAVLP